MFQSFKAYKLLPSLYLLVSKFSVEMSLFSYYYTFFIRGFRSILFCTILLSNPKNCSICLQPLESIFSVDAWGNPFHNAHEKEGIFCHSCSRIISQGVTQGGYFYSDGRHICSLCTITAVHDDSVIQAAYRSVISQFEKVGIINISNDIPINLVDLNQLNQEAGELSHVKLKGFTRINPILKLITQPVNSFQIFILFGLPRIEFEAVLAHELLHVWLHENKIILSLTSTEGFCNLGSYLIYNNDNTHFSTIHLQAMDSSDDLTYGEEYRNMKAQLKKIGWKELISSIVN